MRNLPAQIEIRQDFRQGEGDAAVPQGFFESESIDAIVVVVSATLCLGRHGLAFFDLAIWECEYSFWEI